MHFQDNNFGWIMLGLVVAEILLIFMLSTPESAQEMREAEFKSTARILGEERALKARQFSNRHFENHFVKTGMVKNIRAMLVPTEEQKAKATGLEEFVPSWFRWVSRHLEGFWTMIDNSYHRVYVMVFMMFFIVPLLIPTLIDGLNERRITIEGHDVAKPVFFHGAKKALTMMIVMPLMVIFLPFTVNTGVWFGWLVLFPAAVWVTSKNVQEL